jgi:predicted ArsR family transcriptional regulator
MQERRGTQVSAVAALDEPTRRRLYDYVVRQTGDVSRDDAAAALALPRTTVAFHLDRLVDERLLDVVHERRTGRTGPGAGRPAKLYRRSACDVTVSLPERRYDLAGQLLADAMDEADRTGESPRAVLGRRAYAAGAELAAGAPPVPGGAGRDIALGVLESVGYEPRVEGRDIALGNCPFHALAQQHTELVCGMNQRLVHGLLDALATTGLTARLRPAPGYCCVRLTPEPAAAG